MHLTPQVEELPIVVSSQVHVLHNVLFALVAECARALLWSLKNCYSSIG